MKKEAMLLNNICQRILRAAKADASSSEKITLKKKEIIDPR